MLKIITNYSLNKMNGKKKKKTNEHKHNNNETTYEKCYKYLKKLFIHQPK